MWMAAYLVHWRRVHWRAGADWFLEHLLDGDPASNHLSWQWVASCFSHKPYFFNRQNLERYSNGRYCQDCPSNESCPFDRSYEQLENSCSRFSQPSVRGRSRSLAIQQPFGPKVEPKAESTPQFTPQYPAILMDPRKPILWVHEEALGPANPALQDYPNAPGLFVFDDAWIQDQAISRKRIGFLYESALSLPLTLRRGDVASEVLRFANATEPMLWSPAPWWIPASNASLRPLIGSFPSGCSIPIRLSR